MIFDAWVQALASFGDPYLWLFIVIGIAIGLISGIVPAVSGLTACALLLPFTFKMSIWESLPLMVAILATSSAGGAITAILLNVPGNAANAPTTIDGFRMTQNGEGARALGASLTSSAVASIFSAVVSLAIIPIILPLVMAIRSADMVFVIVLGLSFVAVLARGSMLKGFLSGIIGLLISFIGYHAVTGMGRFTYGIGYLYEGIRLVPVALGLFAVPEMIQLATEGGSISKREAVFKGLRQVWLGLKDSFRHWHIVLRGSIIGFIVGIAPGIGPSVAGWVSYAQAKQTSRHPERFGTGTVEGVIAPESANSASEAGDLLTTLALGIPGSGAMALVLGAIIMAGIVPGPDMMTKHLDMSIALMLVIIVSIFLACLLCLLLASQMARLAFIPGSVLVPLVLIAVFVGAYATDGQIEDVILTLVLSAVGCIMAKFGFNRPALFLGFLLGAHFERYLFISLQVSGPLFFMRPISLTLIFINLLLFVFSPAKRWFQRRKEAQVA